MPLNVMELSPNRFNPFKIIFSVLLLLIILPLFIPFTPKMPAPGVDPSWALGLNQAIAQGLAFGKEIIFTLGPYSSIYTKFYHPATDSMMLWGSVYLACAYWFALLLLMKKAPWLWILALSGFLLTLVYAKDSLLFSYPLLVGLILFNHLQTNKKLTDFKSLVLFGFLFSPLGLLPLIKGSLLIVCGIISILSTLVLFYYQRYLMACFALIIPFISLVTFWLLAGQDLVNIAPYIDNSLLLAFSFTEAMSIQGNGYEVITYILISLFIFALIIKDPLPKVLALFLFSLFFVFLFLSFKAGFTRHFGHAFIASTSLLIASLLLPYCIRSKLIVPVVLLALVGSFYIEGHYRQINLVKNIQSTYSAAWYGLMNRIKDSDWLENNFILTMNFLKTKNAFPVRAGTSDIYSYEQTDLIASGNAWSPRPILQSYSVFNAALAKVNRQHLLGERSPDTIFFKMQPIDNRLPSLEEGSSWPIFLKNYQANAWVNGFLVLLKNKSSFQYSFKQLSQEGHHLGETVLVPDSNQPVFFELELRPTVLGSLMSFFFKLPELNIIVKLKNGIEKPYRFIPQMAKSACLLNPLIENTQEFALLYQNDEILHEKQVASFKIQAARDDYSKLLWSSVYVVHFKVVSQLL